MLDWEAVARSHVHPLRLRILELASEDAPDPDGWSAKTLAHRLGAPIENVAYHVRALAGFGHLRKTCSKPIRGAVQNFYCLTERKDS